MARGAAAERGPSCGRGGRTRRPRMSRPDDRGPPGADGRPRTRLSSKVPLRDGESGRRAVLSTTVDITARKELEHA